jgi:hypothetical protein
MLALLNFIPKAEQSVFEKKVRAIADRLGFTPDWLMAVMYSESGFNPAIKNPMGGATGLIQFMPATAKWLGTSTDELAKMSRARQLDFVELYFSKWGKKTLGKVKEFADLYLLTFYPKALIDAWPDSRQFSAQVYAQNRGIDLDKDKIITVGEFKKWATNRVIKKLPEGYAYLLEKKKLV